MKIHRYGLLNEEQREKLTIDQEREERTQSGLMVTEGSSQEEVEAEEE
jgi:hypothetical protein